MGETLRGSKIILLERGWEEVGGGGTFTSALRKARLPKCPSFHRRPEWGVGGDGVGLLKGGVLGKAATSWVPSSRSPPLVQTSRVLSLCLHLSGARKKGIWISMPILHPRWPTYPDPIWRVDLTSSHLHPPTLSILHFSGVCIYDDGDLSNGSQGPRASKEVCAMPVLSLGL